MASTLPPGCFRPFRLPAIAPLQLPAGVGHQVPSRAAIVYYDGDTERELSVTSYADLDRRSDAFAAALIDRQICLGDRVAYFMINSPALIVVYYGILKAGAVPVPCNTRYLCEELFRLLVDAGAKVIVVDETLLDIVQGREGDTLELEIIVNGGAREETSLDALTRRAPCAPVELPDIDVDRDLALLPYTGGSTGVSKGAMLTHYNMVVNPVQWARWYEYEEGREVFISALPLSHLGGISGVMSVPITVGATMILFPRFNPRGF